jgi:hypothetical protein
MQDPPALRQMPFKNSIFWKTPLRADLSSGIVCPFFVFMLVQFDLISAIMSNLKPSEKDI